MVWLHASSDGLTALAYFVIPLALLHFVRKRKDLAFNWMFVCFAVFIIACGTTHVMEIITIWSPYYWVSGIIKAITAVASVMTAILLVFFVIPAALDLPSPEQLKSANSALEAEIRERKLAEAEVRRLNVELEQRVTARTAELNAANQELVRDIAERQRTEEALRRTENRFAKIFHSGPVSIGMTTIAEGRFIDVNQRHCQLFGGTREDTIGRTVGELNLWEDPRQRERILSIVRQTGHCGDFEARLRCRNGEIRNVLMAMEVVELQNEPVLLTMLVDITDRKRTEQALMEAESKFRTLVEQSIVGIYIIQGDRFTYANPGMTEILGRPAGEITSGPLLDLIHPEDRAMTREKVRLRLEGALQSAHYQLRMLRPTGEVVHVEAHGGRVHYDGQATIIGTLLDITERKQAEVKIQKLNEELEQRVIKRTAELQLVNQELEAFAYSVSHDLRAPLRGIDGFSQALQQDYGETLNEDGKKCLARVRAATQRMGQLIDDLLALSRVTRTSLSFQTVDLSALATIVINELQQDTPNRKVEVSLQTGLTCRGDARLLQIVLYNLLSNAWKFTRKHPAPRIEFGQTFVNATDAFFVRDNGAGFDMAYTAKLFGAFQRLHSTQEYEGTGIGLATVQRIIHRHHGKIWAEGAVNQGAAFYFTLSGKAEHP